MKRYLRLFAVPLAAVAFLLSGCSSQEESGSSVPAGVATTEGAKVETQKVGMLIDFPGNFIFSTYDVQLFVDAEFIDTLPHGEDQEIVLNLENGEHFAWFVSEDDSEVRGEVDFTVDGATELKYKIGCSSSEVTVEKINRINPSVASSEALGMESGKLEDALREAGFSNISLEEDRDLSLEDSDKRNTVKSVSIGGKKDFSKEDEFYPGDEVKIVYHAMGDLEAPVSSSEAVGMNVSDVEELFKNAGFTEVNLREESPAENDEEENRVNRIVIWGEGSSMPWDFSKGDKFGSESTVMIYYTPPAPEPSYELEKTKREEAAKDQFETYGEILYPKFKCHWLTGTLNFEDQGDGTYFIKVEVTVKDIYGQERRTVAQGIAGNGNVVDFYVS